MEFINTDNMIVPSDNPANSIYNDIDSVELQELERILREAYQQKRVLEMQRTVDSAVHLLGSKQDIVHTTHRSLEDREEWDLVVFDGHGFTENKNPYNQNKYERYNLVLLILQELISTGELDTILARDIYSEESPVVHLQKLLSQKCIEHNQSLLRAGATMSLVQIRRVFETKKVTVNVETVGDSPVSIYCNGEKVFSSVIHDYENAEEMKRLADEKRLASPPTIPSTTFKVLDENTLCSIKSKYVCVGFSNLAMTQSLGHINYNSYSKKVCDEKGVFGLAPFKATLVFDETDEVNIKASSDGVSDIVVESLPGDKAFLATSNATETADFAKARWEQLWKNVWEHAYADALATNTMDKLQSSKHLFGSGKDDVCCVSWIQSRKS